LATGYVARRGAGRLRDQGPHLEHPNYRTALTRRRAELTALEEFSEKRNSGLMVYGESLSLKSLLVPSTVRRAI
jgi:hypothetical protein